MRPSLWHSTYGAQDPLAQFNSRSVRWVGESRSHAEAALPFLSCMVNVINALGPQAHQALTTLLTISCVLFTSLFRRC